jgi:hypothetical protein
MGESIESINEDAYLLVRDLVRWSYSTEGKDVNDLLRGLSEIITKGKGLMARHDAFMDSGTWFVSSSEGFLLTRVDTLDQALVVFRDNSEAFVAVQYLVEGGKEYPNEIVTRMDDYIQDRLKGGLDECK